jgi:hypothetical protein
MGRVVQGKFLWASRFLLLLLAWQDITGRMPRKKTVAPDCPSLSADGEGRLHISRYHSSRHFGLFDNNGLVVVTVYKKGAEAVRQRLEAEARTIEDLQRQIAALTESFREQATLSPQPPFSKVLTPGRGDRPSNSP